MGGAGDVVEQHLVVVPPVGVAQEPGHLGLAQPLAVERGPVRVAEVHRQGELGARLQNAVGDGEVDEGVVVAGGEAGGEGLAQALAELVPEPLAHGELVALAGLQLAVHVDGARGVVGLAAGQGLAVDAHCRARRGEGHRVGELHADGVLGVALLFAGDAGDAQGAVGPEGGGPGLHRGQGALVAGEAGGQGQGNGAVQGQLLARVDDHLAGVFTLPGLHGDGRGLRFGRGVGPGRQGCELLHGGGLNRLVEAEGHAGVGALPAGALVGGHAGNGEPRGGEGPGLALFQGRAVGGLDPGRDLGRVLGGAGQGLVGLEDQGARAEPALLAGHGGGQLERGLEPHIIHLAKGDHGPGEGDRDLQVGRVELAHRRGEDNGEGRLRGQVRWLLFPVGDGQWGALHRGQRHGLPAAKGEGDGDEGEEGSSPEHPGPPRLKGGMADACLLTVRSDGATS